MRELRGLGTACELMVEAAGLLSTTNAAAAVAANVLLRKAYEPVAQFYLANQHALPSSERKGAAPASGEADREGGADQLEGRAAAGANQGAGE